MATTTSSTTTTTSGSKFSRPDQTHILITGSNGGVGYATAQHLSTLPNNHIIITSRDAVKGATALSTLRSNPSLHSTTTLSLLPLDVASEDSIIAIRNALDSDYAGHLDVLINNAGVLQTPEMSVTEAFHHVFPTNVLGPMLMTQHLRPLLERARSDGDAVEETRPARLIHITSSLGSLELRKDTARPTYRSLGVAYRASKAALNMIALCHDVEFTLAQESKPTEPQQQKLREVKVFLFDPGFVVSNLSGEWGRERVNRSADKVETSAEGVGEIVLGKRDGEAGGFLARWGKQNPW